MSERWIKATEYIVHSQGTAPDEWCNVWVNMGSDWADLKPEKIQMGSNPEILGTKIASTNGIERRFMQEMVHFVHSDQGGSAQTVPAQYDITL